MNYPREQRILEILQAERHFDVVVGTGTRLGDTINIAEAAVGEVVWIERDPDLAERARVRFAAGGGVRIVTGDAAQELAREMPSLRDRRVLFWLDARLCGTTESADDGDATAEEYGLLVELLAISQLNGNSVVLIDHARLLLARPLPPSDPDARPSKRLAIDALSALSSVHRIGVIDGVIAFYPPQLEEQIATYGVKFEVDRRDEETPVKVKVTEDAAGPRSQPKHSGLTSRIMPSVRGTIVSAFRKGLGMANRALVHPLRLDQYSPRSIPILGPTGSSDESGASLPSISVVMPSFNQAEFVEESIQSVLCQGYPSLDFVIQDGGSTDGSCLIIERYREHVAAADSTADDGQAHAINKGFSKTSGEIMGWLNSDDLLLPGALLLIGRYFAIHPEVDVVYGCRVIVDESGWEVGRWTLPADTHLYLDWADYVPQESLYWRRSLWDMVGGALDESMSFALDWELLLRFRDANARFARLPAYLGAFRLHGKSKTVGLIQGVGASEMSLIRKNRHGRGPTEDEIHRELRRFHLKAWSISVSARLASITRARQ